MWLKAVFPALKAIGVAIVGLFLYRAGKNTEKAKTMEKVHENVTKANKARIDARSPAVRKRMRKFDRE